MFCLLQQWDADRHILTVILTGKGVVPITLRTGRHCVFIRCFFVLIFRVVTNHVLGSGALKTMSRWQSFKATSSESAVWSVFLNYYISLCIN